MRAFTTTDRGIYTYGRGWTYAISKAQLPADLWNPGLMVGETVTINGTERVVRGVERFCVVCSPEWPYKANFGLLVNEEVPYVAPVTSRTAAAVCTIPSALI